MAFTTIDFDKLVIESVDDFVLYSRKDGSIITMMDQLKEGTIEGTQETTYGTGRNGVKLSSLDKNKGVKITATNGYVVASTWAAQMGSDIEKASTTNKFAVPDLVFIEVTDKTKVALEKGIKVAGKVGNEIPYIYKANADKTCGEKFPIAAVASDTEFSFKNATEIAGAEITLPTDVFEIGDIVIIPFDREATLGKKLSDVSTSGSANGKAVFNLTCSDICDNQIKYHTILVMPNAKLDGNWSLAIGTDPTSHPISLEAQIDPCHAGNKLINYYIA